MSQADSQARRRRLLVFALLGGVLLVTAAIMLAMPRMPGMDAQAEVLAARLDQALDRDPAMMRVRVAVLPLSLATTADDDLDYLRYAIAEALTDQLALSPTLRLSGRRSVQAVVDAGLSRAPAARVLDAGYLLDGTVSLDEEHIVVEIRLWNAGTSTDEWVMRVQSGGPALQELPWRVAQRVRATVLGDASPARAGSGMSSLAAEDYRQYLRARYLLRRGNARDSARAVALLDELLARAHDDTRLIVERVRALASLNSVTGDHWAELYRSLVLVEETVLPLTPSDPDVLGLAAMAATYRNDLAGALSTLRKAKVIDPNHVDNLALAAQIALASGYLDEARQYARQVALLDPVAAPAHQLVALTYGVSDSAAAMVEHALIAQELGLDTAGYFLGFAALRAGEVQKGIDWLREALVAAAGPTEWLRPLGVALQDQQQSAAARAAMDAIGGEQRGFMDEFFVYYAMIGDVDRSLQALEVLRDGGYGQWTQLLWLPELRPVRAHENFSAWLTTTTLPDTWQVHGPPDLCEAISGGFRCQ